MDGRYRSVHATKTTLVADLKDLADEYKKGSATDAEVRALLAQWKENTPGLFLAVKKEDGREIGYEPVLSDRIKRLIGTRRALIVQAWLDNIR